MAQANASNFPIPSSTNIFACVWKLTRVMKTAGWLYKASGVGGPIAANPSGIKDTSGTGTNDLWGSSSNPASDVYSNVSTSINAGATLPQTTITVLSTTSPAFTSSGTISVFTSLGWQNVTYTGTTGTTFTGCSGGTGTIVAGYPVAQGASTIGLDQVTAWIVLSGPQTQRVPISAAPTGTPLRGEIITQAGSGAEGELLGYVWDTGTSSGWMAVLPHSLNSGTAPATPFVNSGTITGAISGATFSPTGTVQTFNREVMISKGNASATSALVQGTLYYGCFDPVGESTQLFSYLATQTGCTGAVGPGMGGTNNSFPSRGIVIQGTAGSTTCGNWLGESSSWQTNSQSMAANCTPGTGVSADGTFALVLTSTSTANSAFGFGFFRLDDTEPGDCDPFVMMVPGNNSTAASFANITSSTTNTSGFSVPSFSSSNLFNATYPAFFGYQARGGGTLDVFAAYQGAQYGFIGNTNSVRVVNSPATTRPLVEETMLVYSPSCGSVTNSHTQYKGRCRWMGLMGVGTTCDTAGSKTLLATSVSSGGTPSIYVGPYDGTTTPVQ